MNWERTGTKISANRKWGKAAPKPICLLHISAYWQWRIAAPKPIWLSLICAYWQWRMAALKFIWYPWFLDMDNDEWLHPNSYDIPDFWILTMKNGCAQTHMISLISRNGQWRMAAPKSVWFTLISGILLLPYKPFLNWWQTLLCLKWRLLRFINMCFFN